MYDSYILVIILLFWFIGFEIIRQFCINDYEKHCNLYEDYDIKKYIYITEHIYNSKKYIYYISLLFYTYTYLFFMWGFRLMIFDLLDNTNAFVLVFLGVVSFLVTIIKKQKNARFFNIPTRFIYQPFSDFLGGVLKFCLSSFLLLVLPFLSFFTGNIFLIGWFAFVGIFWGLIVFSTLLDVLDLQPTPKLIEISYFLGFLKEVISIQNNNSILVLLLVSIINALSYGLVFVTNNMLFMYLILFFWLFFSISLFCYLRYKSDADFKENVLQTLDILCVDGIWCILAFRHDENNWICIECVSVNCTKVQNIVCYELWYSDKYKIMSLEDKKIETVKGRLKKWK